ncbi:TrkA-N domain protein [Ruminiclostridium papyrosolvens DSM 2782]|uniref:TrkA-N domain protein n=1 Tax=Ruminiclostridium papyrosolvens DSM 2782 TaxID=588581 RepID=F1THT4_9FIRM|nr:TrkA family potassium uptake protein [Ruminiclostridium papyrosolvens]EGD46066.1 TrkA-N domain protein [Ruminiclostridium papyrosolvens DSM 2782]WES32866.1 TrkA family potassium uptake protein [Ruminiclostridium papyrosolvens DSM 2782]
MQVVIIGCGKVGAKFAQVLSEEGNEIVIVSNDPKSFKNLPPDFDGVTLTGVPIDQDVLKMAGIENADVLVAVTEDDNVNIMVCQVAKEIFKVPKVIARIYNPAREHVFHQFGLETICPTDITVNVMRAMLESNADVSTHNIGNTSVLFKHVKLADGYIGKRIEQVKLKQSMIFGVMRSGEFLLANAAGRLVKGDILVVADTTHKNYKETN